MSDDALTVLLVPDAMHPHVRELLARWVDAWLLDPCYLVRTGGAAVVRDPRDRVATVAAEHMVRGRVRDVPDLIEDLADRPDGGDVGLVRVVELVVSESLAGQPREGLRAEADLIAQTLLRAANRRSVHRVALIVLPTGEAVRADGLRQPAWEVNVLAVPENRSMPAGWDGFVRMSEPRGVAGFALAHAATVGGLWAGMRAGAWDDVDHRNDEHVQVQRVTVRAVLHGHRRIGAALATVGLMAATEHDPVAKGFATLRAPDGARVATLEHDELDEVAGWFVDDLLDGPVGRPLRARLDGPEGGDAASGGGTGRGAAGGTRRSAGWHVVQDLRARLRSVRMRRGGARTASAPAEPPPTDPAERERLDLLAQRLGRVGVRRRIARDGTLLARWPRPLRDLDEPAAPGVWRPLHAGVGLLLDAGVRRDARGLAQRMAEHGLTGVARGAGTVVADLHVGWSLPEGLHELLSGLVAALETDVRSTDLLGLRIWHAALEPWVVRAEAVLESEDEDGSSGMTKEQAELLLASAGELSQLLAEVSSSVVGRVQLAWHDEFGRVARAVEDLRSEIAGPGDAEPVVRRSRWGIVAAVVAAAVGLAAAGSEATEVAVPAFVVAAAAASWVLVRRWLRPEVRSPEELIRAAEALIVESERCERVTDDLGWMVDLLSHLVHHGIAPRSPEGASNPLLEDDDLPVLVRTAVPDERDEDGTTDEREPPTDAMLVCLEDLLETGWRTACHDVLLEDVVRRERLVGDGVDAADALDRQPRLALEVHRRLRGAGGDYEARVAEHLLRRGVRSLEGSLRPDEDLPERLTRPGMPGSPGSRVRIIDDVRPSADMRRDVLARSISELPNWDAFLLDGVGGDDPWSASHFQRRGRGEEAIQRRRTRVHGPVRLRAQAEAELVAVDDDTAFVPLRGDGGSQVEVVVRVDTQPDALHVDTLRAFDPQDG